MRTHYFRLSFLSIAALIPSISLAATPVYKGAPTPPTWHVIGSIEAGGALAFGVGDSQSFPILNPTTDEFFDYHAHDKNQSSSLFGAFLGVELTLNPEWLLDVGLDYNQTGNLHPKGSLVQGADVQSEDHYSYHYKMLVRQLLVEGKLLYQLRDRIHPYLLAGIGVGINKAFDYTTNIPPFITFTREYAHHTETSFSYTVGLGIDVDLNDKLRAGVGYRYADYGKVELGGASIDGMGVNGTLSQSHLRANEILGQLTWIF